MLSRYAFTASLSAAFVVRAHTVASELYFVTTLKPSGISSGCSIFNPSGHVILIFPIVIFFESIVTSVSLYFPSSLSYTALYVIDQGSVFATSVVTFLPSDGSDAGVVSVAGTLDLTMYSVSGSNPSKITFPSVGLVYPFTIFPSGVSNQYSNSSSAGSTVIDVESFDTSRGVSGASGFSPSVTFCVSLSVVFFPSPFLTTSMSVPYHESSIGTSPFLSAVYSFPFIVYFSFGSKPVNLLSS